MNSKVFEKSHLDEVFERASETLSFSMYLPPKSFSANDLFSKQMLSFESEVCHFIYTYEDGKVIDFSPVEIIDRVREQLKHFFIVKNPKYFKQSFSNPEVMKLFSEFSKEHKDDDYQYAFFPYEKALVRMLSREKLFELMTNSNRGILNIEQQKKLSQTRVLILGQSVGFAVTQIWGMMSRPDWIGISDPKELHERAGQRLVHNLTDNGINKTLISQRWLKSRDPGIEVSALTDGLNLPKKVWTKIKDLTEDISDLDKCSEDEATLVLGKIGKLVLQSLSSQLSGADIIVEEVDDIVMKILIRLAAFEMRVPVIMGSDIDNLSIIDLEFVSKSKNFVLPFHGRLTAKKLLKLVVEKTDVSEFTRAVLDIVDKKIVSKEFLDNMQEMGNTIVSIPQDASTVYVTGGHVVNTIREIALNGVPKNPYREIWVNHVRARNSKLPRYSKSVVD